MPEVRTIAVDGEVFPVQFTGWHRPLDVYNPPGRLWPWTLGAHAAALAGCTGAEGADAGRFVDAVLSACWEGEGPGPRALALWWAVGAEAEPAVDCVEFGEVQVSLRPWSFAARLEALRQAGALEPAPRLELGRWLMARVRGHVCAVSPEGLELESLPCAPVLAALEALERPADGVDLDALPAPLRLRIRWVCEALGWTPAQVLAAPAVEVDRVLGLLAAGSPAAAPAPLRMEEGLASKPGAVVFRFEPDEEGG